MLLNDDRPRVSSRSRPSARSTGPGHREPHVVDPFPSRVRTPRTSYGALQWCACPFTIATTTACTTHSCRVRQSSARGRGILHCGRRRRLPPSVGGGVRQSGTQSQSGAVHCALSRISYPDNLALANLFHQSGPPSTWETDVMRVCRVAMCQPWTLDVAGNLPASTRPFGAGRRRTARPRCCVTPEMFTSADGITRPSMMLRRLRRDAGGHNRGRCPRGSVAAGTAHRIAYGTPSERPSTLLPLPGLQPRRRMIGQMASCPFRHRKVTSFGRPGPGNCSSRAARADCVRL